jgi:hypothetical protein
MRSGGFLFLLITNLLSTLFFGFAITVAWGDSSHPDDIVWRILQTVIFGSLILAGWIGFFALHRRKSEISN